MTDDTDALSDLSRRWAAEFAEFAEAFAKAEVEATRPITLEEINSLDDPEILRGRVALRLLERYVSTGSVDATMPDVPRQWLATDYFEAEWANGGFDQFVDNQAEAVERTLAAAIKGYAMLGSPTMERIASDVLRIVRSEPERARRAEFESRASMVDNFSFYESELLGELDSEMIQMDLERAAFVRANPSEFVG